MSQRIRLGLVTVLLALTVGYCASTSTPACQGLTGDAYEACVDLNYP